MLDIELLFWAIAITISVILLCNYFLQNGTNDKKRLKKAIRDKSHPFTLAPASPKANLANNYQTGYFKTVKAIFNPLIKDILDQIRERIDPLPIPDISIPNCSLFPLTIHNGSVTSIRVKGLRNMRIPDMRNSSLKNMEIFFSLQIPQLEITGHCNLNARLFGLLLPSPGEFNIGLPDANLSVILRFELCHGNFQAHLEKSHLSMDLNSVTINLESKLWNLASYLVTLLLKQFSGKLEKMIESELKSYIETAIINLQKNPNKKCSVFQKKRKAVSDMGGSSSTPEQEQDELTTNNNQLTHATMSLSSNQQSHSDLQPIYEGCYPDDELFGEKLVSIVGYASRSVGINNSESNGQTPVQTHQRYCEALSTRIKSYEPYTRSITIKDTQKQCVKKIAEDITALIPRRTKEFDMLISKASEQVAQTLRLSPQNFANLFYQTAKKERDFAEFVVFKVFKGGENLHLIPCLFKVTARQSAGAVGLGAIYNWADNNITMSYQQRTYVLTKFDIKQIIEKLKRESFEF